MKYFFSIVLLICLLSCQEEKESVPKDVLERDEMISVMVDVEIAQALLRFNLSRLDTLNQEQVFNTIFIEHQISEEEFNASLTYYSQDPKVLEGLYVDVVTAISEKQAQDQ